MNKEFFEALDAVVEEKGIPKEYMAEKVEAALLSAYKRDNGGFPNAQVKLDFTKKELKLLKLLTVVENVENDKTEISLDDARAKNKKYEIDDIYEEEVKTHNFGRISAQTAKQVIIQGIREAERGMMLREYEEKKKKSFRRWWNWWTRFRGTPWWKSAKIT